MMSLFLTIYCIALCKSQLFNQYIKGTGPNGEDLWNSTSDFKPTYPVYSSSTYFDSGFGKIKLGQQMSIEFDFLFHGRTESEVQCPSLLTENFFRIGRTAYFAAGCSGFGSQYPSFSLAPICGADILEIGFSTSTKCPAVMQLFDYGQGGSLSTTESHHIKITMNNSLIMVEITGGGQPNYVKTQERTETRLADLGYEAPVWFMSNKRLPSTDQYNLGNATFSNIKIISNVFVTADPTLSPTQMPVPSPTTNPSASPTESTSNPTTNPSSNPTQSPSNNPSSYPTNGPTNDPTIEPTSDPTAYPTTSNPTIEPTAEPTTSKPTKNPTIEPTKNPSAFPTFSPSEITLNPTSNPTPIVPTTGMPTMQPTEYPTTNPSNVPSANPTTSYPTTTETKKREYRLKLEGNYVDLQSFLSSISSNCSEWASVIIENAMNIASYPELSSIPIEIDSCSEGSIVIDYNLQYNIESLLNLAIDNVNSSTVIYDPAQNVSFNVLDHYMITLNPTSAPTLSPSLAPSSSPTDKGQTLNPSVDPTLSPSNEPTIEPITSQPSNDPTNYPTQIPSIDPTNSPSLDPTADPTNVPTSFPTRDPTKHPTKAPSLSPSALPTNPSTSPTNYATMSSNDISTTELTEEAPTNIADPYTIIFYGAIAFVAFLLIFIAICCYCKFKPPKDESSSNQMNMYLTGNSSGRKKKIPVPRQSHTYDGYPTDGHPWTAQPHQTEMTNYANTESRERTMPSSNMSEDDDNDEINSSDEEVLGGQYGGRIIAHSKHQQHVISSNQDVSTTNTPHRRHYIDSATSSPQQHAVNGHHNRHNIVTPIDMNKYADDDEEELAEEDEYYEEDSEEYEDEYEDEEEEEESENEYVLDRERKKKIQQKVQNDLKQKQYNPNSYAEHIFDHQQNETAEMDDIVRQMDLSANGNQQSNTTTENYYDEYDYYHQ